MNESDPKSLVQRKFETSSFQNELLSHKRIAPSVLRDGRGRILWRTQGNVPEDNLRLGISNIQSLVLSEAPELVELFEGKQDLIEDSRKSLIESLILEKAKNSRLLSRAAVHGNNSVAYPSGYCQFGSSLVFTIATSFRELGLFEKQLEELNDRTQKLQTSRQRLEKEAPEIIKLVDGNTENTIKPIGQLEGKVALLKLLDNKISLKEVPPIYITDLRKRKNNPSLTFYLKTEIPGITLNIDAARAYEENGALLFIPKENEEFNYKWIDVYGVGHQNEVNLANKVGSLRINTENGLLESHGWYGTEQQAFFDYITGGLQLENPNFLPPFTVDTPKGGAIYFGRVNNKAITTAFHEKTDSEKLIIVPHYDKQLGYFWIDGYEAGDHFKETPLFTRRVMCGSCNDSEVKIIDWKGPQIQSVIDWAYNRIPASLLREVEIQIKPDSKGANISLEYPNLIFQLNQNASFDKTQPIHLVAKEKGPYRWIEIQQDEVDSTERRVVSTLFVDNSSGSPILKGGWSGPEKQALIDCLNSKGKSECLTDITTKLDGNRLAHIVYFKGKALRIALRSTIFKKGDEIVLTPVVDDAGNLILEVRKPEDMNTVLARSFFDKDANSFKTTSSEGSLSLSRKYDGYWTLKRMREIGRQIYEQNGDLTSELTQSEMPSFTAAVSAKYPGGWIGFRRDLGLPQADRSGMFQDKESNIYASVTVISEKIGLSFSVVDRLLGQSSLRIVQGRGFNNKRVNFYNLAEAIRFIKQQKIRKTRSNIKLFDIEIDKPITPEEANEELKKLLED